MKVDPSIINDRIKEFRHLYDIKTPIKTGTGMTLVPAISKVHADEFVSAKRPRAVVAKIYEEGFPVETGAVIKCFYPARLNEYICLMEEEDKYHTLKALEEKGDGVILK